MYVNLIVRYGQDEIRRSIIKTHDDGSSSDDPVGWILNARNSHQKHKVGRVTGSHQHTLTDRGLVNWAIIALELLKFCTLARSKQHHWATCKKHLRITLIQ